MEVMILVFRCTGWHGIQTVASPWKQNLVPIHSYVNGFIHNSNSDQVYRCFPAVYWLATTNRPPPPPFIQKTKNDEGGFISRPDFQVLSKIKGGQCLPSNIRETNNKQFPTQLCLQLLSVRWKPVLKDLYTIYSFIQVVH